MPEPILHDLPMRWADLDSLNHVNNVVYLDYASEVQAILATEGALPSTWQPATMKVEFLRPLLLSRTPVTVASTVLGDQLVQEICVRRDDALTVFCRITSNGGAKGALAPVEVAVDPTPIRVRQSDIADSTGHVSSTKMFELFQEGRILYLSEILLGMSPGRFVVGTVEVRFGEALGWRPAPYETRAWVSRVGGSSFTIEAEISDGGTIYAHATSTLVGFDLSTQRSRKLDPDEVEQLGAGKLPN